MQACQSFSALSFSPAIFSACICCSSSFANFKSSDSIVFTMISDARERVTHLWSAGRMNHGAHSVLVAESASSKASW
jgi:hypothetical protein